MNDTNLKKEFREDAIDRFENQIATYYYTLQQYPDSIVYIESICPKKGMPQYGIDFMDEVTIIDPKTDEHKASREKYAKAFWESQKRRGKTLYECNSLLRERNYYAAMMVKTSNWSASAKTIFFGADLARSCIILKIF